MTIPMTDLTEQYRALKLEIDEAVHRVLSNGTFILGDEVKSFETAVAAYTGVAHAVGVASGTDALLLALLACGIGEGDEVITTPFSFIATSESIARTGATPVFVDIEPDTLNIDCQAIAAAITPRTKGIVPVHLYGQPCDMKTLMSLAKAHNLRVVEDCAQAQGATWHEQQVGSFGDCGCFSFFPSKMLGAYGDGGLVTTNNADIAERLRVLRNHGAKTKYYHDTNGFNSRLDSLQAAVLRVKLQHLPEWIGKRRAIAAQYAEAFDRMDGVDVLGLRPGADHVFNYYTVRIEGAAARRDSLSAHLKDHGIATAIYYPKPLHVQEVYAALSHGMKDFPNAALASQQVLSLPIYPEMTPDQVGQVTDAVASFKGFKYIGE